MVVREVRSRYYGMVPYFLAKLSLDGILLRAIPVLLYTSLLYPLMGLQSDPVRVALWCMLLVLFACTIGALAMAITAIVKTPGQANLVMNIFLLQMVLVAGYLVNKDSIPDFMIWLHYLSVFFVRVRSVDCERGFGFEFEVYGGEYWICGCGR